jgi:hypothetical protein
MNNQELIEQIHKRLIYDRELGTFTHNGTITGTYKGQKFGSPCTNKKLQGKLIGVRYQVDHLVWLIENGNFPNKNIKHIDGNNENNNINNLTENHNETIAHKNLILSRIKLIKIKNMIKKSKQLIQKEKARIKRNISETIKRKENPEKYRSKVRISQRKNHEKNKNCELYKSKRAARQILNRCIRQIKANKEYTRTEDNLGYSFDEFKKHIENQFESWMTWGNHGEWHIDHKIPIDYFIKKNILDIKIINALDNLQPLIAIDNIIKGNKVSLKKT